ncbi:MAG TPA: hypothetical protein VF544_19015 [Pyrinomonadaceae bacterium]|jgi:hypothetical protein
MLRGNHHQGGHGGLKLLSAILPFKRRKGAASEGTGAVAAAGATSVRWDQTFWGRRFLKSTTLMLALLCSAAIAVADIKISTKSSAGGRSMTSTTYVKGARQRTEGVGYTSIYQCDLKRTIYINDKTKTYFIAPLETGGAGAGSGGQSQRTAAGKRKGGVVTYTTTNTDTGERREIMGMTARHLKSRIAIEASEGACNSMNMEMETDGWYVDLPDGMNCATDGSATPNFGTDQSDCVDEVRFKSVGTVKLGYPVQTTTRMKFNTGTSGSDEVAANIPESSSTQEVLEISKATLDAALFEIPQGYTEVKSMQELGSPY